MDPTTWNVVQIIGNILGVIAFFAIVIKRDKG